MKGVQDFVDSQDSWQEGKDLIKLIETRKMKIYENPIILAGIFLDPRFRTMLSAAEKNEAKQAIRAVLQKNESMKVTFTSEQLINVDDEQNDELGLILGKYSESQNSQQETVSTSKLDLELGIYEASPAVSSKTNPITFWKMNMLSYPLLHSIASDIICIPVTEVTSERLFSFLNIVFNKLRAKLDPSVIEDILFLRWNKKLI